MDVLSVADSLHEQIATNMYGKNPSEKCKRDVAMLFWLDRQLPLLFTYFYLPVGDPFIDRAMIVRDELKLQNKGKHLGQLWEKDWSHIKSQVDSVVSKMLGPYEVDKKLSHTNQMVCLGFEARQRNG